jgi:hypothetical protein
MDIKESIKYQALEVSELLTEYIEIHDYILKNASTFISLFRRVDFDYIYNQTENVLLHFNKKKKELIDLKSYFDDSVPEEYRQYFQQLFMFFEKLYDTVALLRDRQYQLLLKSKGEKYSYKDFVKTENNYKKAIEFYMIEAQKLENIGYIIFK